MAHYLGELLCRYHLRGEALVGPLQDHAADPLCRAARGGSSHLAPSAHLSVTATAITTTKTSIAAATMAAVVTTNGYDRHRPHR